MSQIAVNPNMASRPETGSVELIDEIQSFVNECVAGYRFNSRWDTRLNVFGIAVSICIVVAGVFNRGALSAILGGVVTATVAAQRAFPFGQRTLFYRNLVGLAENLKTDVTQGLVSTKDAVALFKTLRLDFAQQLSRGGSSGSESGDVGSRVKNSA